MNDVSKDTIGIFFSIFFFKFIPNIIPGVLRIAGFLIFGS